MVRADLPGDFDEERNRSRNQPGGAAPPDADLATSAVRWRQARRRAERSHDAAFELAELVKSYDPNADEDALIAYVYSMKAHGAHCALRATVLFASNRGRGILVR